MTPFSLLDTCGTATRQPNKKHSSHSKTYNWTIQGSHTPWKTWNPKKS